MPSSLAWAISSSGGCAASSALGAALRSFSVANWLNESRSIACSSVGVRSKRPADCAFGMRAGFFLPRLLAAVNARPAVAAVRVPSRAPR
jgi:hypothetical protein